VRVLLSAFGFDGGKVTDAMRLIGYDRLILITSEDNTFTDVYKELLELNAMAGAPVETLLVDKFDLMGSEQAIVAKIEEIRRVTNSIALNVTGGRASSPPRPYWPLSRPGSRPTTPQGSCTGSRCSRASASMSASTQSRRRR
jgi:hypothetical protein